MLPLWLMPISAMMTMFSGLEIHRRQLGAERFEPRSKGSHLEVVALPIHGDTSAIVAIDVTGHLGSVNLSHVSDRMLSDPVKAVREELVGPEPRREESPGDLERRCRERD